MKRLLLSLLVALLSTFFLVAPVSAGQYSGLWVGTATLKYVSEVNKQYSDLSFDLGLVGVKAHDTMISTGAVWKYNDTSALPGSDWMIPGFDDTGWSANPAPLGLAHGEATTVTKQTTVYFRKNFSVPDLSPYSGLKVRAWRDDGLVLYLNGEEIFRDNLPSGSIDFNTFAQAEITEDPPLVEFTLPTTLLQVGENLLAAEVHLASGADNDLFMDLELSGTLEEPANSELIGLEASNWKYHDSRWGPGAGSEEDSIDADWQALAYNDSGWPAGQPQFGYGEDDQKTTVSESAPTIYFRKKFSVNNSDLTHLRLLLLRDDGAVVYVNGSEILRSNMPAGIIEHTTAPVKGLGSADEGRYLVVDVDVPALNPGPDGNVVAVELHQHPAELGGSSGGSGTALTRTAAVLELRLLFHVDGGDQVRLLKEVIQVYDSSTQKYVLLTDHTKVPNYTGVAVLDGEPVGRRLSSVGFDFAGTYLECNGALSKSGAVECLLTLKSDHPTNPFLHRYHPDHDNLDERYENMVVEAYEVKRTITLSFSDRYPPDEDLPQRSVTPAGWGDTLLGGYYDETLTGLHKDALRVYGPFILRKVVNTDTLTP